MCYTTIMRGGEYEKGKNRQSGIHCKETQARARRISQSWCSQACFRWTLIFMDKGIIIELDKLEFVEDAK